MQVHLEGWPAHSGTVGRELLQKEGEAHPHLADSDATSPRTPLLTSNLPACISSALSLSFPFLPPFPSLFAAPPVKGKRKPSEGGDPLDSPLYPLPNGDQSRSQSPAQLEVSRATSRAPLPCLSTASRVTLETPGLSGGRCVPHPPRAEPGEAHWVGRRRGCSLTFPDRTLLSNEDYLEP